MNNNPFLISFGLEPDNYITRLAETENIKGEFNSNRPSNFTYIITGMRGSGKTVLLSSVAKSFKEDKNWIVVDPGAQDNLLENVASEIYETARLKSQFLKKAFNFSFSGFSFSIKGDESISTVNTLLKRMLEKIKADGKRVLITIDEIAPSDSVRTFIQCYQSLLRLDYPVMLLMTGLYENISNLQNDKTLTFLYRAPKIFLSSLPIAQIANSYAKYLDIDDNKAIEFAKFTKGYAYAYQVLGYLLYKNDKRSLDRDIIGEFDQYLYEYVYEKVYSEMSENEQRLLKGFTEDKPMKVKELSELCGMSTKYQSVYRDRLIKKGVLISPSYGTLALALPRFFNFLATKD